MRQGVRTASAKVKVMTGEWKETSIVWLRLGEYMRCQDFVNHRVRLRPVNSGLMEGGISKRTVVKGLS